MKGKDIKCSCGAGPVDVDPELEFPMSSPLGLVGAQWAVQATCGNGHGFIAGVRSLGANGKPVFEVMNVWEKT